MSVVVFFFEVPFWTVFQLFSLQINFGSVPLRNENFMVSYFSEERKVGMMENVKLRGVYGSM